MQAERTAYRAWQAEPMSGRVFCVDESGIAAGERVRCGYAKRGQRCVETAPYRLGRRTNMVGFVCSDGSGAVTTLTGLNVCRVLFAAMMRQTLVPKLEAGDVVVWDNHTIHKDALLVAEIEAKGASVRWLPRYSPDMNPAEWLWSWLKRRVRVACADTSDAVIGALREAVSEGDVGMVEGWIRQGGFQLQPQAV